MVASPQGQRWQLIEAEPACARAGLGDVLAGYAAGRGAMAIAGDGATGGQTAVETLSALLAAMALDHAQAGLQSAREGEQGRRRRWPLPRRWGASVPRQAPTADGRLTMAAARGAPHKKCVVLHV